MLSRGAGDESDKVFILSLLIIKTKDQTGRKIYDSGHGGSSGPADDDGDEHTFIYKTFLQRIQLFLKILLQIRC